MATADKIKKAVRAVNTPGQMAKALNDANKPKNAAQAAAARGASANNAGYDPSKIKDARLKAALAKPTDRTGRK